MNFFKSKNVKIFPCYSRGYFDSDGNPKRLFDPEARLITETNFANIYGNVLGRRSYIVEIGEGDEQGQGKFTKAVIQGYYFELADFAFAENQILHIKLTPSTLVAASDDENERITYSLASLAEGVTCLDVKGEALSYSDDDNKSAFFCTAIGYTSEDEGEVEEEGYYSLAYNGALRLDLQGEDFINKFKEVCDHAASTNNPHKVTAAQLGLDNVENKSTETIKSEFTGAIAQKNTGFVTGGAVYDADKALEERIDAIETFFEGAYAEDGKPLTDALDTLQEIQEYIDTHGEAADQMIKDIKQNADDIEALTDIISTGTDNLVGRVGAIETSLNEGGATNEAIEAAKKAGDDAQTTIDNHKNDKNNPHGVTKAQVGLGNVDNMSVAEIKTEFTGSVTDGNDNFVTGDMVFDAITAAKAAVVGGAISNDSTAQTVEGAKKYADEKASALIGSDTDTTCAKTIKGAKDYADNIEEKLLGDANKDTAGSATIAGAKKYADSLAKKLYGNTIPASDILTLISLNDRIDDLGGFTSGTDTPGTATPQNLVEESNARIAADEELTDELESLKNTIGVPKNDEGTTEATGLYHYIDEALQEESSVRLEADNQLGSLISEGLSELGSSLATLTEYSEDIGRRTTDLEEKVGTKTDYEELAATAAEANNFATNLVEQLRGTSSDNSEQITLHGVKKYFIEQLGTPSVEGETGTEASGVYAFIEARDEALTARINGIVGISGDDSTQVLSLLEEQQLREKADEDIWEAIGAKATPGAGTEGEEGYVAPTHARGLYQYIDGAIADSNIKNSTANNQLKTDLFGSNEDNKDSLTVYGLRKRIDEKVASVDKEAGTAITVDNSDTKNPKIGLDLNNTGNVTLSQTDAGLSADIDLSAYKTDTENEGKYKQLQEAITATTTDANVFVDTVAQDANGVIILTTKTVDFSNYYTKDETEGKVHDHVNGTGTVVSGSAAGGDVAINLNLEFAALDEDKKLKLVDKTSKAIVAEFNATDFIQDGMLDDVFYNADTNELTFTWNTDAGKTTDVVALSDILDPYVFEAGALLDVATDGTKVTYSHKTVTAPTGTTGSGRTYLTGVETDGYGHITGFATASETDQDLSDYKTKQTAYEKTGGTKQTITKVTQSDNGVIEVTYGDIDFSHNHTTSEITDFSSAVADIEVNSAKSAKKVAHALTIKTAEAEEVSFDGSEAHTIDISHVTTEINKLTGDDTIEGSVANLVKTAVERAIIPKNIYAVAFDANGGEGTMQPQVCIGESYKLPECSFEPCDRFKGWGTSVNAETPLTAGTEYTLTANTIFYALWETNEPNTDPVEPLPETPEISEPTDQEPTE